MTSSLLPLKLKIIAGYVIIVLLFFVLLSYIYKETNYLRDIDKHSEAILRQHEQAEDITLQILSMSLLSEQLITWNEEDITLYKTKRIHVSAALQELQKQISNESQRKHISSILLILSTKESQIMSVVEDLKELRSSFKLLNTRIPGIIQKTQQDKKNLVKQIGDNYRENEQKSGSFLGLFRSKKKSALITEKKNEAILNKDLSHSNVLLSSFAHQIQHAQKQKSERLLAHMDILNQQNAHLNQEIIRLITEFSRITRLQAKARTDNYLMEREKAFRRISGLSIAAALLAFIFYLILQHDLKKRYRYRLLLERLNRENEQLLRSRKNIMLTISHDLRSPLSTIRGCTELLEKELSKKKRFSLCETIVQSSDSMTALLNSLLDFQRLDSGKIQTDFMPFRLKSFAEVLKAEFSPLTRKAGLKFSVEYSGLDVVVMGDRERLLQIARNLLSNAVKFTPKGEIQLSTCYSEKMLTITVSDTGTGMTQEQTEKIFLPFERLENAESQDGFGLGLPIMLGLTALLKGSVKVQSKIGKGSTFSVQIPLEAADEEQFIKDSDPTFNLPSGLKIIAIDDDNVLLSMAQNMLMRHRVLCDTCNNIEVLTSKMRELSYDLLITDIRMPQITGFELLELLRTSDIGTSRTIPILALTARADCCQDVFTTAGFTGCLHKPFSEKELFSAIQHCIAKQPVLVADFTALLSSEKKGIEMLELFINDLEMNLKTLSESMGRKDIEAIVLLVHHLLPLWEIVQTDAPLRELNHLLAKGKNINDEILQNTLNKVSITGHELIQQAKQKIKEIRDE